MRITIRMSFDWMHFACFSFFCDVFLFVFLLPCLRFYAQYRPGIKIRYGNILHSFRCKANFIRRCAVQINPLCFVMTIFPRMPRLDSHYLIETINRTLGLVDRYRIIFAKIPVSYQR